jgi:hypothetical protein
MNIEDMQTKASREAYECAIADDLYLAGRWRGLVGQIGSFQFDCVVATTATPDGQVEMHTTFFGMLRAIEKGKLALESRDATARRKVTERVLYVPAEHLIGVLVVPDVHHGLSVVPSDPLPFSTSPTPPESHR